MVALRDCRPPAATESAQRSLRNVSRSPGLRQNHDKFNDLLNFLELVEAGKQGNRHACDGLWTRLN